MTRQQKLNIVRSVIAEEKFTPEEINLPSYFDIIAVCAALRSLPINITTTKLTIIIILASEPCTQRQLQDITSAEQSHLSHVLSDMREKGFITKPNNSINSTFSLTPSGKNLFTLFLRQYYKTLDALSTVLKNTKLDN